MMLKLAPALLTGFVAMGGWAVVTVKDLPEYFVAGQQYTIEFQVRQHGRTLLSGLRPQLVVNSTGARELMIPAGPLSAGGTYAVRFTAPASGPVTLTIRSGFMNNQLTLYPQTVVAAGGARVVAPVDGTQVVTMDVRVELRRGEVDVTQRLLYRPQVGSALQKVSRERVPQRMRRDAFGEPGAPGVGLDHAPGPDTR